MAKFQLIIIKKMLKIKDLSVNIWEKEILHDVNIDFELGKNYCILGRNGSGKSTLGMTIAWHPIYEVVSGDILVKSEYINSLENIDNIWLSDDVDLSDEYISIKEVWPDVRARVGIFVAMQSIPEVPGVKLFEFLRQIYNTKFGKTESFVSFKKIIQPMMESLGIDKEFLRRDLNVGFSGGERRKIEILQLKLLQPKYIILDEVDSGLDVDAFRAVAELLKSYNSGENTLIVITHYFEILNYISVDEVVLMADGRVVDKWDMSMIDKVKADWFVWLE